MNYEHTHSLTGTVAFHHPGLVACVFQAPFHQCGHCCNNSHWPLSTWFHYCLGPVRDEWTGHNHYCCCLFAYHRAWVTGSWQSGNPYGQALDWTREQANGLDWPFNYCQARESMNNTIWWNFAICKCACVSLGGGGSLGPPIVMPGTAVKMTHKPALVGVGRSKLKYTPHTRQAKCMQVSE